MAVLITPSPVFLVIVLSICFLGKVCDNPFKESILRFERTASSFSLLLLLLLRSLFFFLFFIAFRVIFYVLVFLPIRRSSFLAFSLLFLTINFSLYIYVYTLTQDTFVIATTSSEA